MAYVRTMYKSIKIERYRKDLDKEKQTSLEVSKGKKPKYSLRQKYKHFLITLQRRVENVLCCKCLCPKRSCLYKTLFNLNHDGTCENFTLKSILGFIGGFFLTYIFFMFFVFQLNFKLSTATIMCSFFGIILTIGLAFSFKVRCVVFLLLPQFFSKRGRQAVIAYAFILAITGPAKNTLHNVGILSESMACGQEQLKAAVRQIMEVIKKPFYAIRDAIRSVVKTVKEIVKKIKEVLLTIKRIIMSLVKVIKSAFEFLGKILNICNKELGTPFQRCSKVFENAITDCNAKLGPMFDWLCSITYLVKSVCYVVKMFDYICLLVEFISDSVIGVVVRKVKIFIRHIKTMFYVRIKFSHSFHFETNQSKTITEITKGIVTEIRQRTENLLTVFDIMSCATSLFFLFIILRVLHYRFKYLTIDRFDNRYITKDFREIDMKRAQEEKETILPLNHRERSLYIEVKSIRLVKVEKVKLSKASVALGTTTLKLSTHMMVDYALYWVLTVIRYHSRFQSKVQAPNVVQLNIEGQGFLASLLKSIVKAFQPLGVELEIDTIPCLPDPIPPDYDRYIQIASLLILCWILTVFEPYGLRLRHSVMSFYHPVRARQRSIWLYNHIMRSRLSFLKFARRQLRRKMTGSKGIAKITLKEYLQANINSKWIRKCLGSEQQITCLLCGDVFRESDSAKPIRCEKPDCPGIYCEQCFQDLQNLCTICLEPIQYGDLSDISEERDSSDDGRPRKIKKKKKKKCTLSKCCKNNPQDDSDDDKDDNRDRRIGSSDSEEMHDSDYHSSNGSSDNSYSYQNVKDLKEDVVDFSSKSQFSDVEKQKVHNYASWDTFKQDLGEYDKDLEDTLTSTSHSSVLSEIELAEINLSKSTSYDEKEVQNLQDPNSAEGIYDQHRIDIPDESSHSSILSNNQLGNAQAYYISESIPPKRSGNIFTRSASTVTPETETSFIETSNSSQKQKGCCPLCKSKTIIKHKCKQPLRVPHLNLNFSPQRSSSSSSNSNVDSFRAVLDSFREKVKYENINETTESPSPFSISSPNPEKTTAKSPLNIGYEIYVPRFDKFVDSKQLLNISTDKTVKSKEQYKEKINEYKNLQRKNRAEEIMKNKNLMTLSASEITSKESSIIAKTTQTPALKAKEYYKKIKTMRPSIISKPIKENNRFLNFMKSFFLKEKKCKKISSSSKSELISYESTSTTLSPNFRDVTASQEGTSQNISSYTPTSKSSGNNGSPSTLNTTSTSTSLMGSSVSHQRGGADYVIESLELGENQKSYSNQKYDVSDTSDSDITDLGVFFGSEVPDKYNRPLHKASKLETASMQNTSTSESSNFEVNEKQSKPFTSTPISKSNVRSRSELSTARYSRQPAERDENPSVEDFRPMKLFVNKESELGSNNLSSNKINLNQGSQKSKSTVDMAERYCCSEINSPMVDEIRNRCTRRMDANQYPSSSYCNAPQRQKMCCCPPRNKSNQDNKPPCLSYPKCCERNNSYQRSSCPMPRPNKPPKSPRAPPECRCCCCCQSNNAFNPLRRQSSEYSGSNFGDCPAATNYSVPQHHHQQENCPCSCFKVSSPEHIPPSVADEEGCCSDCSGGSEFPDLVYQNRDEFLDLVSELGDTLSLRNKERVQKAIREFEMNSRQNKNLEKPVFTDESDDSSDRQNCCRKQMMCNKCKKKKRAQDQACPTKYTKISTRKEHLGSSPPSYTPELVKCFNKFQNNPEENFGGLSNAHPKFQQNISSTHWEIDPRTGEWYKVYNNYSYEDDYYLQLPLVPPVPPKRCNCDSPRRLSPRTSPERCTRNYSIPPPCCRCNNCGFLREKYSK